MSIHKLADGRWRVRTRMRVGGQIRQIKKTVFGTRDTAKLAEAQIRIDLHLDKRRSLTITNLGDALSYYRQHSSAKLDKVACFFDRMTRDLGKVPIRELSEKFGEWFKLTENDRAYWTGNLFTNCTRNKFLCYAKTALNFCVKRGLIDKNPLAGFSKVPEEGRDRVLTEDEEQRLLQVLELNESYLYWPVRFSLKNPIRKGDLITLTKDNLDRFRPWVHFFASKTRSRKNRETCLPFLDDDLLAYFDTLPPECPYLFPRALEGGEWKPLGDFKKHWGAMLEKARIEDFHFHDLKHCAITWILDNGHSDRDLKNLGIQYNTVMIDRYYKHDAQKVLNKWKTAQGSTANKKTAIL